MIWGTKSEQSLEFRTDLHSHLIPGVDDGVDSADETFNILRALQKLGIGRAITTPHIYEEIYPNTEAGLEESYHDVISRMPADVDVELILAAEYFVDEFFYEKIRSGNRLLTLPGNFVLIETSFFAKPVVLEQVLFKLRSEGYNPILAHPERYQYIAEDPGLAVRYIDLGASLQVNAGSIAGHYGPPVKRLAFELIKKGLISFVGSDIHKMSHVKNLEIARNSKIFRKGPVDKIKNDQLAVQ